MTTEAEQRQAVIAEALSWERTPYHHRGRLKGIGTDCAMYLLEVYHACGLIPHIDPGPYPPDWYMHRDEERYFNVIMQYAHVVTDPQPGDLAAFKFGRCISHGGIILAWPMMLHAENMVGVVRCNLDTSPLLKRLVGYYSLWGPRVS